MKNPAIRLVAFDIDGTLISTQGAGMRAFYRAFQSVLNISVDGGVIRPDGMTDPLIVKEILKHFGMADQWSENTRDALFSSYLSCLEEEMSRARELKLIRVLPGVAALLEAMSKQPDFAVGLVTGNLERGAIIKLKYAGLDRYFGFGGFGSDSEDRTELTRVGLRRGAQLAGEDRVKGAFVIGDTPLDIIHGHAAGATVIAVASAGYGIDDLQAHNPDLAVPDLTEADSMISFMRNFPHRT